MIDSTRNLPITNSHLPIRYHLAFTKTLDKWQMENNLASDKWQMVVVATKGAT